MENSKILTPEQVVKLYRTIREDELNDSAMVKWLESPTPKLKKWLNDLGEQVISPRYGIGDRISFIVRYTAIEEELIKRGEL